MSIITRMLKQNAVFWAFESYDKYGAPQYSMAENISCRWEDKCEEFIDAFGDKQLSRSIVYVSKDTPVKGVLCLGDTIDVNSGEPLGNPNAWEIRRFEKIPNLRNTEYLRIAYL